MMAAAVWTNVLQPLDVSASPNSVVSPLDALLVINELNNPTYAPTGSQLPVEIDDNLRPAFVDVTCDGRVTPLDALLVINSLNTGNSSVGNNPIAGKPTWHFDNSGGSAAGMGKYVANACSPRLVEGDSYASQLSATITVPDMNSALRVHFAAPTFDTTSLNSIRDAFEILVLDATGKPLTFPYDVKRDASFNWSESVQPAAGVGTQTNIQPASQVSNATFNLTGIEPGTAIRVVVRLVNNDSDTTSGVTIRNLDIIPATDPAPAGMSSPSDASLPSTVVDTGTLTDVSTSVVPIYGQTSLYERNNVLVTDVQLQNQSANALSGRLIAVIDSLSDPTVIVEEADGFLPGGRPYIVLNSVSTGDWLAPGERTQKRELRLRNAQEKQFTYTLTTLAELNRGPSEFTSTPLREIEAGRKYELVAKATDPDGQALRYQLDAAPSGMTIDASTGHVTWQTASTDVGNHAVLLRATDPYGLSVTQSFTVAVIETLPNRPPVFDSSPSTEAKVAGTFEVHTFRVGDQPAGISGGMFDGQHFQIATANTASADLTIGSNTVSVGQPKPTGKLFQTGQDVDVGFPDFAHANDVNAMESFAQGDFNHDGNLDFITSGIYRQYDFRSTLTQRRLLTITLGDGQGGFATPRDIPFSLPGSDGDHIYYLKAGDFNSDGKLDLLGEYLNDNSVSGSYAPRLIVWPGRGDGSFGDAITTDLNGLSLGSQDFVDINRDGKLDIVAVNSGAQRVGVLLGNGDGTFGAYTEFANLVSSSGRIYYGASVGDLDGVDGPDIVLPDWEQQKLHIYLNDGHGALTLKATLNSRQPFSLYGSSDLTRPQSTWISDFDGDGKADIVYAASQVANSGYSGLGIYKGTGDGINFQYADAAKGFQQRAYNSDKQLVDFNGDGHLDILVGGTPFTSNYTVGVALGRGDGTFDVAVYGLTYAEREFSGAGDYAVSIVLTGDYNRDGLLDVAVTSGSPNGSLIASSSGLSILYAESPGVLAAPRALPGQPNTSSTVISLTGDVNNDGIVDLVIGAGDRFSTRRGNSDGTFGAPYPATDSQYANDPHYAALVDLDHDGILDLLWSRIQFYQGASQGYMAALGNGDGTFRTTFNLSAPGSFYGGYMIPPADFNGDGYVDFAAHFGSAFAVGTAIDVYLYNPAVPGTFTASYRYLYPGDANGYNASAINYTLTRGDFDGDGHVDLLSVAKKVADYQNRINFFKGKGDGTFEEPTSANIFLTNTEPSVVEPRWTESGDLNHDGKLDFVLVSAYGNQSVFLGNGDGTFAIPIQYSESHTFGADRTVVLKDIDGDGHVDLSMAAERGRRGISIRRGRGDGTFTVAEHYFLTGNNAPGAAAYSDMDLDGVIELVIADNSSPNYTVIYPATQPGLVAITTADVNGDGHLDALAVSQTDGHVKLMLGTGAGSLVRQPDLLVGKGALALVTADLNQDQNLDIVTANRASRSVSILTNDGASKFVRRDIAVGELLNDLAQGDFAGDGRPRL